MTMLGEVAVSLGRSMFHRWQAHTVLVARNPLDTLLPPLTPSVPRLSRGSQPLGTPPLLYPGPCTPPWTGVAGPSPSRLTPFA